MAPWPHDVSQDLRARHFNAASRYGQSRRGRVSFVAQIGNRHAHSSMLKRKRWLTLETCRGHWLVIVYVLIQLQKQTSAGFTLQVHVPYSGWVHLSIPHEHKWNTSDLLYTDLKIAQSMHFFPPLWHCQGAYHTWATGQQNFQFCHVIQPQRLTLWLVCATVRQHQAKIGDHTSFLQNCHSPQAKCQLVTFASNTTLCCST